MEVKTGKCYVEYKAVLYRSQTVAGTNTLAKVNSFVIFEKQILKASGAFLYNIQVELIVTPS